ncbi:unnamed protein product [Camellia sinensis]
MKNGQTIVSSGKNFVLGFFSPPNSTFQYFAIWYNNISVQTVIWVANRDSPIRDKNGILAIGNNGNLMVLDGIGSSMWSSNASIFSINTTAMLMDTGNLILLSNDSVGDTDKALWQSFNNPTDTFLPGMRVHTNAQTGQNCIFTSWMRVGNPSPGSYSMGIDPMRSPQIVLLKGPNRSWRSGYWNGSEVSSLVTGFLGVEGVKLPDFASTVAAENIEECEDKCLTNCSCNALAFVVGDSVHDVEW